MPFAAPLERPSIQLGTLGSYLETQGIPIDVHHAYLRCADHITLDVYRIISSALGDEFFYPYFLFPKNFERYRKKIESYYNNIARTYSTGPPMPLIEVLERLNLFNQELLSKTDFSKYSLMGFSVTYDQLKPSLYLARKIKERHPSIQIVFGGAQCTGELGIGLLKTFPEIDFFVSGEGELTLTSLSMTLSENTPKKFEEIKGLGWRGNGSVRFNGAPDPLNLKTLPPPNYDQYFELLEECSSELKTFVRNHIVLPIEGSRGCWWNKCTFCNLNAQHLRYREKNIDTVLSEVQRQIARYRCQSIIFIDNIQRIKGFGQLMEELKNLSMDLSIFLQLRAGQLKKEDYRLMRDAGVKNVFIGIEALGSRMLKKMKKGVKVIENITAIKQCYQFGILPLYLIICNYPNEEEIDLQETAENISFFKSLIPPVKINPLWLGYGSPIYNHPRDFNIKEIKLSDRAVWLFPEMTWQTLTPFFHDYTRLDMRENSTSAWQDVFGSWQQTGMERITSHLLFHQDMGEFLIISDKLSETKKRRILEGIERELYLFCDFPKNKQEIIDQFPDYSTDFLEETLDEWIQNRWMFREGDQYLSLSVKLNASMPPLTYLSAYSLTGTTRLLSDWMPNSFQTSRWNFCLKLGSFADLKLSLNLKKKPPWLRKIKKAITRKP